MKLYLIIIGICSLILTAIVSAVYQANFFMTLAYTALGVVAVILVDALVATVSRLLPKQCANHEKRIYKVGAKEKKFYEKLHIRKWKDKIPEIGHFTGFRKNKIADPKSVEYLDRFLMEACYGEIGHFFSVFFGFIILLLFPLTETWWAISIPVVIINALLNLPSLFVLRYNSYKLEILRKSNLKKQARVKQQENE